MTGNSYLFFLFFCISLCCRNAELFPALRGAQSVEHSESLVYQQWAREQNLSTFIYNDIKSPHRMNIKPLSLEETEDLFRCLNTHIMHDVIQEALL